MQVSKKLLTGAYNKQIEESVRKYLGKEWKIESITENKKNAMHCSAVFEGSRYNVFVKEGENPYSHDQFIQEAWGLKHIRENSPIYTPEIIDVLSVDGTALLIMEAIDLKPVESKEAWVTLGQGLATLHKTVRDTCGLETHSYLGIFRQDNTQSDSWVDFFANRRIRNFFAMAKRAGNLSEDEFKLVEESLEKLILKLPDICGPKQPNSLLHGDPWLENLLYDGKRLIMIDCSIYYGNREIDLSTVDIFCPVSDYFFEAYHDCYPIDPGYKDRIDLWRVYQLLDHITFSRDALPNLMGAINKYIR